MNFKLKSIFFNYEKTYHIFEDLDLTIKKYTLGIVGRSGSAKK